MVTFSEIQEVAKAIGIPATTVVVMVSLFQFGVIPSESSRAYEAAYSGLTKIEKQQELVNLVMKQHGEQMTVLMRGLREICFNTAKTNDRERACGQLEGSISVKP